MRPQSVCGYPGAVSRIPVQAYDCKIPQGKGISGRIPLENSVNLFSVQDMVYIPFCWPDSELGSGGMQIYRRLL